MDIRLRAVERDVLTKGGEENEAAALMERMRAGEFDERQVLLAAAAGVRTAQMVSGVGASDAAAQCGYMFPAPPPGKPFVPIYQQVTHMHLLNSQMRWGFSDRDFVSLPVPVSWPADSYSVVVLVPYLHTVQATFDALWRAILQKYPGSSRWHGLRSSPDNLRLLPGARHPGKCLRWETISLGTRVRGEFTPESPAGSRDPKSSPHAGILAAAIIHAGWVREMARKDTRAPFVWLPGYQAGGDPDWPLVPWLSCGKHQRLNIRIKLNGHGSNHRARDRFMPFWA